MKMSLIGPAICAFAVFASVQPAFALTPRESATAIPALVETGWYGEGVVIHAFAPVFHGCGAGQNTYFVSSSHLSYKTIVNIALGAALAAKNVVIVYDADVCVGGRASVLGIRLAS